MKSESRVLLAQCIGLGAIAGGVFGMAGPYWGMIALGGVFVAAGVLRKLGLM